VILPWFCYFYQLDHLGTPQEMTDWEGRIVWSARYRVYGNVLKQDVEEVQNNLRFQGQYWDEETGLHYNRFRYYDPGTGQFTQQDPIGLLGCDNFYQYADNPVQWIDPVGLTKYVVIGEGQAAVEHYARQMKVKFPSTEFRTIKKDWANIVKSSGAGREKLYSKEWERKAVQGNADWIEKMHKEGYEFIDIGVDSSPNRSAFYVAEKETLNSMRAKVYKGNTAAIEAARASVPMSDRPPSKVIKGCKE